MKTFLNSSLIIVLLSVVSNLFFSACSKDNNEPAKASIPLIASISSFNDDGMPSTTESFQYDNQGRLIQLNEDAGSYSSLSYSGSAVTMKNYNDDGLTETLILSLNNKGLCESVSLDNSGNVQTNEYDSNGYRQSSLDLSGTWESATTYTVLDGNYVTIRSEYNPKASQTASLKTHGLLRGLTGLLNLNKELSPKNRLKSTSSGDIDLTEYLFYTDKINTIDYENWGISFLGKQNKNPIKQEAATYWDGGTSPASYDTISYQYEYDAKGRITKQLDNHGDYSVFTYVE